MLVEVGESIGLQDRFGEEITNGCTVQMLVGQTKGLMYVCVWNIPNHRFGFIPVQRFEGENPDNTSSLWFYATPRNSKNLKVINL